MHELTFEKWVYGGDALGRLEGQVVLAPRLLPGETARVSVEREEKGLLRAQPVEILKSAPQRVAPPCPYFGRCGGCHYQHASYEFQLEQKQAILREALRRVGKIEAPETIETIAGEPWGYRNRVQLHVQGAQIGYREAGSHTICTIEQCPVASPRINQAMREHLAGMRFPRHVESIELFTNEADMLSDSGVLDYPVGEDCYRVSRYSFFQVNRFLIGALVERATGGRQGDAALDLYAGVGLFSVPLGQQFGSVTAVESGAAAHRDLCFNAASAGANIRAERADVERYLEKLEQAPDFVLADPPRAGLGKAVVRHLIRLRSPRLTIVSCDPATLARDLAALASSGYRIDRMTMVDLFPQTFHIETVVELTC